LAHNLAQSVRWEQSDHLQGGEDLDESRKRVLLIASSILAARKLAQYDSGARIRQS